MLEITKRISAKVLGLVIFVFLGCITSGMALAEFETIRKASSIIAAVYSSGDVPPPARNPLLGETGPAPGVVTLSLVGDVLLADRVETQISHKGVDYPWEKVAPLLVQADIAAANLECAVSTRGQPEQGKQYTFRASPKVLEGAKRAGVDVFTLANNHVLDFGAPALEDTLANLRKEGFGFAGAGQNSRDAFSPVILERNGLKVGFLAFSRVFPSGYWVAGPKNWGIASGHDYRGMLDAVKDLDRQVDLVVVSIHWGKELAEYPGKEQSKLGRMLVDAGADVVAGHHPHVIQGIEFYKNKPIAYSLGNFIFTSASWKSREGIILLVQADKQAITSVRAVPTFINQAQPVILQGEQKKKVLQRLAFLSSGFNTLVSEDGALRVDP